MGQIKIVLEIEVPILVGGGGTKILKHKIIYIFSLCVFVYKKFFLERSNFQKCYFLEFNSSKSQVSTMQVLKSATFQMSILKV